jgi:S-adenosylmethionine:tRNA ribosyltransferase-isomerase
VSEIEQYDYELPKDLIAQRPLPQRSDARLMIVDRRRATLDHAHVRDLAEYLDAGDCLVLNDTRVIPARLVGHRQRTGGRWDGLFVSQDSRGLWRVLGKTRGRLNVGERIMLEDREKLRRIALVLVTRLEDGSWVARPETDEATMSVLERVGRVPLPPYIRSGEMIDEDRATYQTVFADKPGAVAAPTAGLHFTPQLLEQLRRSGVKPFYVTLHVGPGTFLPVKTASLAEHTMHSEWGCLDAATAEALRECRQSGRRIVAVGTTVARVLETAARGGPLQAWQGQTELFIRPPFEFRAVDSLMTNFHLPKSTLLVLVRTFGGDALLRRAYEEAVREQYRFYSYGDAMLIV